MAPLRRKCNGSIAVQINKGQLIGFSKEVEGIVFPLEIDGALESQIRKIQDNYEELSYPLGEQRKDQPIERKSYQTATINYYNSSSKEYISSTRSISLNSLYSKFRNSGSFRGGIPRGGLILDAGCGSGRDTRYFIQHGYRVVSFDASEEMVRSCLSYPFSYCIEHSFEQIDYLEEFDAVWACASLLHLKEADLKLAMERLYNALVPNGVIYFSLKNRPEHEGKDSDSRQFFYYEQASIESLCEELGLKKVEIWENTTRKQNDTSTWVNYIYEKVKVYEGALPPAIKVS
ncbi:hypothetical protein CW735_00395 [Alteromonas sp. MB-3u-76]|uniref:class I SAM-dependent DNA methyltransferase n=1 Tax=Alteromonas sp. MB-3u-76 TaxID=2058133 RepID=UPI000C30AA37|nr:class I SAM-dependent methyltransferase [Alteromonas sp. MB-3u-76]AUC86832.1 hypothetical protein CW735_00395 [Alteromonas sp. MB-3u-76]